MPCMHDLGLLLFIRATSWILYSLINPKHVYKYINVPQIYYTIVFESHSFKALTENTNMRQYDQVIIFMAKWMPTISKIQ